MERFLPKSYNLALLILFSVVMRPCFGQQTDPSLDPFPVAGFGDSTRALVLRFSYQPEVSASITGARLSKVPASGARRPAEQMYVQLLDESDFPRHAFFVPYPSWQWAVEEDGTETLSKIPGQFGHLVFPFSMRLKTLVLRDMESGEVVLEQPMLGVFQQLCEGGETLPDDFCSLNRQEEIFKSGFE